MFDKKQAIFTYTLSGGSLVINETDGVTAVAMKLISGTGSYQGTKQIGAILSTATSLVIDSPVTITAEQSKYIDLLTITSGGVIEIIAR